MKGRPKHRVYLDWVPVVVHGVVVLHVGLLLVHLLLTAQHALVAVLGFCQARLDLHNFCRGFARLGGLSPGLLSYHGLDVVTDCPAPLPHRGWGQVLLLLLHSGVVVGGHHLDEDNIVLIFCIDHNLTSFQKFLTSKRNILNNTSITKQN